jgi:hypothetical protein
LEGGTPAEIAPIVGDTILGNLAVSPDGKFLVYQSNFFLSGTRDSKKLNDLANGIAAQL